MNKYLAVALLALLFAAGASTAEARWNRSYGYRYQPPQHQAPKPKPKPPAPAPTPAPVPPAAGETRFTAYVTAYTYWDNTPPGSADISNPVLHSKAGGTGTYADPITVAVGHSITNGKSTLDYPAGTRFYIPNLRRYFIVEDACGDGSKPQNGPCHTGYPSGTTAWLDIWIDGAKGTNSATQNCAYAVTGNFLAIKDPAPNYAVVSGPVYSNGCATQYGNTVVQ